MTARTEQQKERRRILKALLLSLLIHLLILVAAVLILMFAPAWAKRAVAKPAPQPEPVELTIMPPSETPKPKQKEFIDSAQATVAQKAPDHAAFESDQNRQAASERPAESNAPVPTLEGDQGPGLTLQTQDKIVGPVRPPSKPSPASPAREAEQKQQEKPQPKTPPQKEQEAKTTPTPRPTPKPDDDELAMLDPTRARPEPKPTEQVRQPETPSRPSAPQPPGFQPQTRVTKLTGGITNRGRASVAAMATPLGRYKKAVSDAIGSRWYYLVDDMMDLVSIGTVDLSFVVGADGKVVGGVKVLQNTSNESLAGVSVRAIIEAELPPIPKDIVPTLEGGRLEIEFSFTIVGP